MKLIKRASRPDSPMAIEQGPGSGIWLVPADSSGTAATRARVDATTVPHPAGGGRRMLRQVPAGVYCIEVGPSGAISTSKQAPSPEEDDHGTLR